jgi:hypothetical protein
MIALSPRDIARAFLCAGAASAALHIADRVIAGLAQCQIVGCGPWR